MEEESKTVSKYNEMEQHLFRLNNIWVSCRSYAVEGNFCKWNWELDRAKIELIYDIIKLDKQKESNCYGKTLEGLDKDILRAINLGLLRTLYAKLTKKEQTLRFVQQECGKGTEYLDKEFDIRFLS